MSMANEAQKNPETETIKNLKKLIDEYYNLREGIRKTSKIENDVYRDILAKAEEIISELKNLTGYDVQTLEEIISQFSDIKTRYDDKFGSRIDKGLMDIKNKLDQERLNDTIRLKFGTEEVKGLSMEIAELSNDIDNYLYYVDKIIKLFVEEYNIMNEPSTAIIESPVNKPNLISQIVYIVKRIFEAFKRKNEGNNEEKNKERNEEKNEGNNNGDNIIDIDPKYVQTISSKYTGYITKKNQLDVCNEIKKIVDNDELMNGLDECFASKFEKNVNKIEYYYGEIDGKKYIAFEDLSPVLDIGGDVVIFIDNRCLSIWYDYITSNITYIETIFDDKKANNIKISYYFSQRRQGYYTSFYDGIQFDHNYYFSYDEILNDKNREYLQISNNKDNRYYISYEGIGGFLRKELPLDIGYYDKNDKHHYKFKKRENSDKYNLGQGYKVEPSESSYVFDMEREYSLEEILKKISNQLPEGANSIVDICPNSFKEAVSKHFEIIPKEAREIYSLLNKAILDKLKSLEKDTNTKQNFINDLQEYVTMPDKNNNKGINRWKKQHGRE